MMSTNDDKGDDDADDSQWYTMRMGDRMMAISDDADDDNDTDDDQWWRTVQKINDKWLKIERGMISDGTEEEWQMKIMMYKDDDDDDDDDDGANEGS